MPAFDLVLTYGGGDAVGASYRALGARACAPIHNAIDPHAHHPVAPQARSRPRARCASGSAARRHVLRAHTYAHRVATLEALLDVGEDA